MNKSTNIQLFLLTLPVMLICIFIGGDLTIDPLRTTGGQLPYQQQIFWVAALLIFLPLIRRSFKRWTGMQILSKKEKFIWNKEISLERKKRVVLYNILESAVLLALCFGLFTICPQGWPIALAYGIGVVDIWIFTLFSWFTHTWRIGITKNALVLADREIKAVYFLGLRKIYVHQETLHFDYINDLKLHLPFAAVADKKEFMQQLWANVNQNKVFLEENAKEFL